MIFGLGFVVFFGLLASESLGTHKFTFQSCDVVEEKARLSNLWRIYSLGDLHVSFCVFFGIRNFFWLLNSLTIHQILLLDYELLWRPAGDQTFRHDHLDTDVRTNRPNNPNFTRPSCCCCEWIWEDRIGSYQTPPGESNALLGIDILMLLERI